MRSSSMIGVLSCGAVVLAVGAATPQAVRLVLAPDGNEARYRVREQLAGFDFPSDAIGVTSEISGTLVLGDDGKVVAAESKFVVNAATLTSDADRRDNYIRRRTLETEQHPTIELVPTDLPGLPATLPASGAFTFQLTGDLTIRGVTRPTTWRVAARAEEGAFVGTASTAFTFETFEITKPRVARVLSVADTIRLEYDFRLVRESGS